MRGPGSDGRIAADPIIEVVAIAGVVNTGGVSTASPITFDVAVARSTTLPIFLNQWLSQMSITGHLLAAQGWCRDPACALTRWPRNTG